jgi:hypothetical protein
MEEGLNPSQPAWQVLAVVLFLIPGLNCTWVIERLAGPSRLKGTERLLRAVAWSVLVYAAASPWLLRIGRRLVQEKPIWPWEPILGAILLIFVAPVVLGAVVSFLRSNPGAKSFLRRFTTVDPHPTAWDFAFNRRRAFLIRIRLRDGERVGGLFSDSSFASAYPEPQQLFIEQAWRLDPDGSFVEPLPRGDGLLIPGEVIEIVEFMAPMEMVRGRGD